MARRTPAPTWINLEYLSAEDWVEGCHGLSSPQPGLPLVRHFYFPGFTAATGGLLRERDLLARRDALRADPAALAALWARLGLEVPAAAELRVSMFAYPNAPLAPLLETWASGSTAVTVLLPAGLAADQLDAWSGGRGRLRLQRFPFLAHADYDRLLWACDFNFVRGEDSFVRAIWAARPFAWHVYPQDEAAHLAKLDAFLARQAASLTPPAGAALGAFMRSWNGRPGSLPVAAAWAELRAVLPALRVEAGNFGAQIVPLGDLATSLRRFVARAGGAPRL